MTDKIIYRNLTTKDIILLIEFSIENDIWGYWDEDNPKFNESVERINKVYNELQDEKDK